MKRQSFVKHLFSVSVLIAVLFLTVTGCGPKYQLIPLSPADPPVSGTNGMVVAAHPLAAEAGINVLKDGGNAVDAAIATLFMLNVVEPHASGLGGGGFAVVRMADGDAKAINFREKAPSKIDPSFYYDPADTNHTRMGHGATAVCVPGAAAGWAQMFHSWATLPLERLARDAINAAENGFPVDPTLAGQIMNNFENLSSDSIMSEVFINDGLPYEVGDTLRQEDLAKTLNLIVERGFNSFYRGPIAESIVSTIQNANGYMTLSDLEFYRSEVSEPLQATFSGSLSAYEALTMPPPSRGGSALLEALNMFDLSGMYEYSPHSAEAIHIQSQCIQQSYIDAATTICDPKFDIGNWQELATVEFAKEAMTGIALESDPGPRSATRPPNKNDKGNTTHLSVVDKDGNAVSLTQTINHFFGAGVMAPGTGLLLNNQMQDFSVPPPDSLLDVIPLSRNLIEGGKRPRSNMCPLIMLKDGKVKLIVGTPGGSRIPAAMAQIVVNATEYGMDISSAIDYPRFFPSNEHLVLENRFDMGTVKELTKTGYILHFAGPYHVYFGGAHGISIDHNTGVISGAADKRRGGAARGY
ncbi:MAG: gamma-glutamyltransferase [Calditrichaeota bacterium]|nr:gamma-glutamyltransferase [Calditrichota bacterium]